MIESIDITGDKYDVDTTTQKYITRKIGQLDRYLPRHARKSITADVKLKQVNRDHGNKYEAEVILRVPDKVMTAKDSTVNMLAAIDIVEAKLANQLRKYKQEIIPHIGKRRLLGRFKRSYAREQNI
jgi:putative sigma-54 modulation protein